LIKILTKDKKKFKATMLYFSILVGQPNYILKDLMDSFMSLKIKIIFKPKLKDKSINGMFLKNIKKFLKKHKTQAQGLKKRYQNIFVKGSKKSQTCVFHNYCCHIGHISLDCELRKENNIVHVTCLEGVS
jgi:hypothetical protein